MDAEVEGPLITVKEGAMSVGPRRADRRRRSRSGTTFRGSPRCSASARTSSAYRSSKRRIPYYKVGKLIRFDPREITHWLAGMRIEQLFWTRRIERQLAGPRCGNPSSASPSPREDSRNATGPSRRPVLRSRATRIPHVRMTAFACPVPRGTSSYRSQVNLCRHCGERSRPCRGPSRR